MARRPERSGFFPNSFAKGEFPSIALCGERLMRKTAVSQISPHRNFGSPVSMSMHRVMFMMVLPSRSDTPFC